MYVDPFGPTHPVREFYDGADPDGAKNHGADIRMNEFRRMSICALAGMMLGGLTALVSPWQFPVAVGAATGLLGFVTWTYLVVRKFDADASRAYALREDDTRGATRAMMTVGSLASLVSVVFGVSKGRAVGGRWEAPLVISAVLVVAGAWLATHTVFALRYAHQYFTEGGGVEFSGGEPTMRDFGYLALTVAMAYQVSDTPISSPTMRALVLRHSLLSYALGAVVIGFTINVCAGLLG
jgi:uncharacterized membrane protein